MGGGNSRDHIITAHVMPMYYIENVHLETEDVLMARSSWAFIAEGLDEWFQKRNWMNHEFFNISCILILSIDRSPAFLTRKGTEGFEYISTLSWFYTGPNKVTKIIDSLQNFNKIFFLCQLFTTGFLMYTLQVDRNSGTASLFKGKL